MAIERWSDEEKDRRAEETLRERHPNATGQERADLKYWIIQSYIEGERDLEELEACKRFVEEGKRRMLAPPPVRVPSSRVDTVKRMQSVYSSAAISFSFAETMIREIEEEADARYASKMRRLLFERVTGTGTPEPKPKRKRKSRRRR